MNQLRVLLLPPGRNANPSQGYPQQYVAGTHLYRATKNKLKKEQRYYAVAVAVAVAVMEHFSVSYSLNKSLKAKITKKRLSSY